MPRYVLYLIAILFAGWTAYTSLTQVQSDQRAVVRRFGRILEQKPQPGLHLGWPWGIDRIDLAPVGKVRGITVGFSGKEEKDDEIVPAGQLLTGDHNLVNVQATIRFRVREADMVDFVLNQDNVDAFLARAAEALLTEWIAGHNIMYVLQRGKRELPTFLQEHLQNRIQAYSLGIEIESASIPRLDPPDQVKDAFDKITQAQTNIRTQINQAEQTANTKKKAAEGEISKIQRQALTYAEDERKNAKTEAANFTKRLQLYRELSRDNPDYLNALWLDDMTRLYSRMKEAGRIELLDRYLTSEGLTITQFPLQPKKK
jgi:membrane protease subunit HflK